jgi:hypothetical protein
MREILGVICGVISLICILGIFSLGPPPDMNKPLSLREMDEGMKIFKHPAGVPLVILAIAFFALSKWLIGF